MIGEVAFLLAFAATAVTAPWLLRTLDRGALERTNYRGERLPVAGGAVVLCGALAGWTWLLFVGEPTDESVTVVLWALFAVGFVGLLDDVAGDRSRRGLMGHAAALRDGEWTTGQLKAFVGAAVAVGLASAGRADGPLQVLADALVIALSSNAVNLLDVRPGRAVKVYLLAILAVAAVVRPYGAYLVQLPLIGAALAYLPFDVRRRAMLGDHGANPLGLALGWAAVSHLDPWARWAAAGSLLVLHAIAERRSLSTWFEHVAFLRAFDMWGREG